MQVLGGLFLVQAVMIFGAPQSCSVLMRCRVYSALLIPGTADITWVQAELFRPLCLILQGMAGATESPQPESVGTVADMCFCWDMLSE